MTHELLDRVALTRDLPEHALRVGDVGVIVEMYGPDAFEVEFVTASGDTVALVTLRGSDVRPVEGTDLSAVRPYDRQS